MAAKTNTRRRLLTLRVAGPAVHPGRIRIPDLLALCQHAQAAVNRQAEALQGRQALRPGPPTVKVREECTLELVSLGKGSAVLGLEPAKPQGRLPMMDGLASEAVVAVAHAIDNISDGNLSGLDAGVLDSLHGLGELLDRGVTSVDWIAGVHSTSRRRLVAKYDARTRERLERRSRVTHRPEEIEGVLEMADFKPSEYRCRIHPALGPAIPCTFEPALAEVVHHSLRRVVRVRGTASVNPNTGKIETLAIGSVQPAQTLRTENERFFSSRTLAELAREQGVEPVRDLSVFAGGWPDDEDLDEALVSIYGQRA